MSVYITPTSIKGLVSTDEQCQWSAWFKARNYGYRKRPSDFDFDAWRQQHNAALLEYSAVLRAAGYVVTIENQNDFKVRGAVGVVKGKVDILAVREGDPTLIVDVKTGRPNQRDIAQVQIYMAMLPLYAPLLATPGVEGAIYYAKTKTLEDVPFNDDIKEAVYAQVKQTGGDEEPMKVPSPSECLRCDISNCDERVDTKVSEGSTGAF